MELKPNVADYKPEWALAFKNPVNGHIVEIYNPFGCTLLFGLFYFAKHEAWAAAIISAGALLLTYGLAWFIIPFFARAVIRNTYLRKGWMELTPDENNRIFLEKKARFEAQEQEKQK